MERKVPQKQFIIALNLSLLQQILDEEDFDAAGPLFSSISFDEICTVDDFDSSNANAKQKEFGSDLKKSKLQLFKELKLDLELRSEPNACWNDVVNVQEGIPAP